MQSSARKLLLPVVIVALFVATLVPAAHADHPGVFCQGVYNRGISNNATQWPVYHQWINFSFWQSNLDYAAKRRDISNNLTFNQSYPGGVQAYTTTPSGYDLFRDTGITRNGSATASYDLEQHSHDGCSS